jgi:RNA polymerase sigma-70 factor (ECF subfamily)
MEVIDSERRVEASAEKALERAQIEAFTREAVVELPRRQREVFTLRIDGGLPFADVAAALDITEANAKSHFHYAVKRLQQLVQQRVSKGALS